jgi:hypothetical protein
LTALAAVAIVAAAIIAWLVLAPWLRSRKRSAAASRPLPAHWREILERNVPVFRRLPAALQQRLEGLLSAFLAEKQFLGCNGLAITDEMRVTIAGQACVLILGRPGSLYDELRSILVYPTPFWVDERFEDEGGLVTEQRSVLSGQAWDSSRIILSWEDIAEDVENPAEGYNLVQHEFAHYLDAEARGLSESHGRRGADALEAWADELAEEFDSLLERVDRDEATFLDPYAAEDEAEFFAVATEEFFERPRELRTEHPRLYGLMREFYGLETADWEA